jgi:hypothetical protein
MSPYGATSCRVSATINYRLERKCTAMYAAEWTVAYLGGRPRFTIQSGPTDGKLRLSSDAFQFVVQGEYLETLFAVSWRDVMSWDVEGTNTSTRETSGGRAGLGALLAGPSGAIIGLAATRERFTSGICDRQPGRLEGARE